MAINFYDYDLVTRQNLTKLALNKKETLLFLWENLVAEKTEGWIARAKKASELIGTPNSVVDLGCGLMTLEQFLPESTKYIPIDVTKRDERTIVVDLNKSSYPNISADTLVALGLFEYIIDAPKLINELSRHFLKALITYNPTDYVSDIGTRIGHAWVNHYSISEFEQILVKNFDEINHSKFDQHQEIYLLSNTQLNKEK